MGRDQIIPAMFTGTITNFNCTYDIDLGAGFSGIYKNLSRRQLCSGTSGQFTLTVEDSSVLKVNDGVYGTSIGGLAKITIINSTTQVTVDQAHTGTITSGIIQFCQLHNEVVTPATGFKLQVRIARIIAGTDAITNMYMWTGSVDADRSLQYPLPGIPLTISGLQTGSDVVILQAGTTTILGSVDSNATTSWVYSYTTVQNIDIGIIKQGYVPLYIRNYVLTSAAASLPIAQSVDRNYV